MENFIKQLAQEHFETLRQAFINYIRLSFPLNGDEITDIYNEVWIDVIENVRKGRTERVRNWKSYVFGLGWKRACKLVTRRAKMGSIDYEEAYATAFEKWALDMIEETAVHMAHLENIERLMMELENLPEKHKEVLRLYYLEGMSTAEIAKAMGYGGPRIVITIKKRSVTLLRERMAAAA